MSQIIYTDGSCIPNPGPGGYAFIVFDNDSGIECHVSGGEKKSTNNRMELRAVIEALKFTHTKVNYIIYTDSKYVINCGSKKWSRKKNIDMWEEYDKTSKGKNITWKWVKGHSNNKYNDIVDVLAKKEAINH
jgi:ribonuclease HI